MPGPRGPHGFGGAPPPATGPARGPFQGGPPPASGPPPAGGPPMGSGPPRGPPTSGGPPLAGGPPASGRAPPAMYSISGQRLPQQGMAPPRADGTIPGPPSDAEPTGPPSGGAGMAGAPPPTMASHGASAFAHGSTKGYVPSAFSTGYSGPGQITTTPMKEIDESLNCREEFMQPTVGAIPSSASLMQKSNLPFGLTIHPLAEGPDLPELPLVNFGSIGIVRCSSCRAYINPFCPFLDNGQRWRCNLCGGSNEVPSVYYSPLNERGKRTDLADRPELSQGSCEFVAPVEYMVRPPQAPVYVFVLDVSAPAVASGLLHTTAAAIKESLQSLPGDTRSQVAFITFDNSIHFYNLKRTLTQPQMMVLSDLDDIFLPQPEDLLVNLNDSMEVINTLLDSLPEMFAANKSSDNCLGAAMDAAFAVMSHIGGKMVVVTSGLPLSGRGKLKNREDVKLLGTDEEKSLYLPADDPQAATYKNRAVNFSRQQISVDMFFASQRYTDIASMGCLARYTAGNVYHYPAFNANKDGARLHGDLVHDLTRTTGFEAVMRIRVSGGKFLSIYWPVFILAYLSASRFEADKLLRKLLHPRDRFAGASQRHMRHRFLRGNFS